MIILIVVFGLLAIGNVIILLNIRSGLKEMDEMRTNGISMSESAVEIRGEQYEIQFGTKAVKVCNSYRITSRSDRLAVIMAIRETLKERNLPCRSVSSMEGEWLLHNIAYQFGEHDHAADVDLEYEGDRRWYVAALSEMLGFTGF